MTRRFIMLGMVLVVLSAVVFGSWLLTHPAQAEAHGPPPVPEDEARAIIEALHPRETDRPLIAIVGINDATEVTDYLMPFGVLRRADVADVLLVATHPGVVRLYPALSVEPHTTVAD